MEFLVGEIIVFLLIQYIFPYHQAKFQVYTIFCSFKGILSINNHTINQAPNKKYLFFQINFQSIKNPV